jgi:erbb2-interacting protein
LINLTELSIQSNGLKYLPPSIGLLRQLHTLYLDDNLLSALPREIGSCTRLTVLSLVKNKLSEIPSEIGHIIGLKVLNVSSNRLPYLPVSILNIVNLTALWMDLSQTKPMLKLNKEIEPISGQTVLTCYLLPQLSPNGKLIIKEMKKLKSIFLYFFKNIY